MNIPADKARKLWKGDDMILGRVTSDQYLVVDVVNCPGGYELIPIGTNKEGCREGAGTRWNTVFQESHTITVDLTRTEPDKPTILDQFWHIGESGYPYDSHGNFVSFEEFMTEINACPDAYRALVEVEQLFMDTEITMTKLHCKVKAALKKARIE